MKKTHLKRIGIGLAVFILAGCGTKVLTINKDLIQKTRRIGILSVVMDNVGGDTPANREIRASVLNHALTVYQKEIAAATGWDVVPVTAYQKNPLLNVMVNIPKNPETQAYLMDLANKNQLPLDNEAVMAQAVMASMSMDALKLDSVKKLAVDESAKEIQQKVILEEAKHYQGVANLPVITYGMVQNEGGGKYHWAAARGIIRKNIASLCREMKLDAVVVVHIRSDITKTGDIHVIVDEGRTKGVVKINPTLVIVAASGETMLLMDYPTMDDLAPMDIGPPIYIGKPGTDEFRADFKDSKGKVLAAFNALVDDTSKKLMGKLQESMK